MYDGMLSIELRSINIVFDLSFKISQHFRTIRQNTIAFDLFAYLIIVQWILSEFMQSNLAEHIWMNEYHYDEHKLDNISHAIFSILSKQRWKDYWK